MGQPDQLSTESSESLENSKESTTLSNQETPEDGAVSEAELISNMMALTQRFEMLAEMIILMGEKYGFESKRAVKFLQRALSHISAHMADLLPDEEEEEEDAEGN